MKTEIKFRWVGRNKKYNKIQINSNLTTTKLLQGKVLSFFNISNREEHGNCEFLSEDLFTGEKDINGSDIYAGDVLSEKWKVEVYVSKKGTFMVKFHTNPKVNLPISLREYLGKRKVAGTPDRDNIIIGNIHENPELLKP